MGDASPGPDGHSVSLVRHDPLVHYCIVRCDLAVGLATAQIIHAAGESATLGRFPSPLPAHTFAVALGVPNEAALDGLSARLAKAGVQHARIIESDAPYTGQLLAIGIAPLRRSQLKRLLSDVPLYRGPAM